MANQPPDTPDEEGRPARAFSWSHDPPASAAILHALCFQLMLVDREHKIVFANRVMLEVLGVESLESVVGRRFGDVAQCIHVSAGSVGCGTSDGCSCCELRRIIGAPGGTGDRAAQAECLLTVTRGSAIEPREYQVAASPVVFEGAEVTLVSFRDVSSEKRREALERVFFHDILNTISALDGYVELMVRGESDDSTRFVDRIAQLTRRLRREVRDQRDLLSAERDLLEPRMRPVHPRSIVSAIERSYAHLAKRRGQRLVVCYQKSAPMLVTDAGLVIRVVSNMVKNATEASTRGDQVRLWTEHDEHSCTFLVHNPSAIPEAAAHKIFERSFSTKAERGRGLGTYSMRLFGERYLGGKVSFVSSEQEGTTFSFVLPRRPRGPKREDASG